MGTYKRLPRGKEKPHDEFRDWTVHAIVWLRRRWISVLEFVGVGIVAVAVVLGAQAYGRHSASSGAQALYEAEVMAPGSDERRAALEEVADDYSRYFAGKRAMMQLGDILVEQGDFAKAQEQFMKLANGSRNQPMLRIAALHKLAEAQLAGGDANEAAATYRRAAADPGNLIPATSELMAAACLERAGEYDSAAELYLRIIDDAGEEQGVAKEMSEERLLWLVAKGYISG